MSIIEEPRLFREVLWLEEALHTQAAYTHMFRAALFQLKAVNCFSC